MEKKCAVAKLDTKGLAEYLRVSVESLQRWRKDGTSPPFIRIGNMIRYDIDDVERWLAENKTGRSNPEMPATTEEEQSRRRRRAIKRLPELGAARDAEPKAEDGGEDEEITN